MPPPPNPQDVRAPIPTKNNISKVFASDGESNAFSISRSGSSSSVFSGFQQDVFKSITPSITKHLHNRRKPSYSKIEISRELFYNLDYPDDAEELAKLQLDPTSRFFARSRPRTLNLPKLLPYETETPQEQAKYLSHIVSHLYIAIKTLDIQGSLMISAKDLVTLQNISGVSDVDLALETDLFNADYDHDDDDDDNDNDDDDDEDVDENEDNDDVNESGSNNRKMSPKSAAVVSVRHWTAELKTWIKMKFDMPIRLKICLAKIYYSICLSRGQFINLRIYLEMFSILVSDESNMRAHGLKLDWEPLYKEIENHFPSCDSSLDVYEKKSHNQLSQLAIESNAFFDDDCLEIIFKKIGSKFSIQTASLTLSSLYSLLPARFKENPTDCNDIRVYIPSIFHLWGTLAKSEGIDGHITSLIGKIADSALSEISNNKNIDIKFGKYGIFEEEQIRTLFSGLMTNLAIIPAKFGSNKGSFFHGYAACFIYSLKGEEGLEPEGLMEYIESSANAIKSYVHPSNSGSWTSVIPKLVQAIVYQYHKRLNFEKEDLLNGLPQEYKLTERLTSKFVEIFLPIVNLGIQSKQRSVSNSFLNTLGLLAYLNPSAVLESVLLDLYESLEGVISTHRVNVALQTIAVLSRYFASTTIFRVHVTRLLTLALPGIDSNDLDKTLLTLHAFASMASFVPFADLTEGNGDPYLAMQFTQEHMEFLQRKIYSSEKLSEFPVDSELEMEALKSSSSAFNELIKALCDRVFSVIKNLPDPAKSKGAEKLVTSSLPKRLTILFESLSDEIFITVANKFFEFISENVYYTVADATGNICGAIVKHDKRQFKKFVSFLIPRIREDIEENGAGDSRNGVEVLPRDQPLLWNVIILNSCVGNAGEAVLDFASELTDLSFYMMDKVKGPASFMTSFLVHQILTTTTKLRITNTTLIAPEYIKKHGYTDGCWGGFQFDDYRLNEENLKFGWHIPNEKELSFAVEFFNSHITKLLENINSLIVKSKKGAAKKAKVILEITDDIGSNLLYLGCALSGISYLFDPSFEEKQPKSDNLKNQSIQQRLLLVKQIRKFASKGENIGASESRIEDIHENLEKIVANLNGDFIRADLKGDDDSSEEENDDEAFIEEDDQKVSVIPATVKDSPSNSMGASPEPPSGRATPQLDQMNDISAMNPSITLREQKLYCSHYPFGDDSKSRHSHELYSRVHKIRHLVGKSLHVIFGFLVDNHHENVSLFKAFLHVVRIWLCDVGSESVLNHSDYSSVSYGYIHNIQHINRVRKPFTRLGLGTRIDLYHRQRVSLHASSRTQTEMDKKLLQDVVKLSTSGYMDIAKPAQSTLVSSMGKLIGSYNVLIKFAFRQLEKAIDEDEHKEIITGLRIFNLKKIKNKIQNDFVNLKQLVSILGSCMKIDNLIVNEVAQKLYKNLADHLNIPSSTCLIDLTTIECIRPPDEFIDLEIKTICAAKSKKRDFYLSKVRELESFILECEKENTHWKVTSLNLSLLINNQIDLEVQVNDDVLALLVKLASSDHPINARYCIKGLSRLFSKITAIGLYEYSNRNIFDLSYVPKQMQIIDTSPSLDHPNFISSWRQEINNKENPNFFIDNKANVGWLFWDDSMRVMKPDQLFPLVLEGQEGESMTMLGSLINKKWLTNVVKLLIADNETDSAFQGTDVYLTSAICHLVIAGYTTDFTFDEILEVIEENYVRDEKSSHVVICELLCGLLVSSKVLPTELKEKRDSFVAKMLDRILSNDLTRDNRGVWNIFSWWLPIHADPRRFPSVISKLIDFKISPESDLPFQESARLLFIKSFITSVTWKFGNSNHLIKECFDNLSHQYQSVREQIGYLISVLSFVDYNESFRNSKEFVDANYAAQGYIGCEPFRLNKQNEVFHQHIESAFKNIELWRKEVANLTSQDVLKSKYFNAALTILSWLKQTLNTNSSLSLHKYISPYIIPFLLHLFNLKEACQLADISPAIYFKKLSQIPYRINHLDDIIEMVDKNTKADLTTLQLIFLIDFIETFYFRNLLLFTKKQRSKVIIVISNLLNHNHIEIRESSAKALSGFIHISPPSETEALVNSMIKSYSKELDKVGLHTKKKKPLSPKDSVAAHAACLGLGALIIAFTYQSPPPKWVPDVLTVLANKACNASGNIGKTSKSILSEFKKTRQDSWRVDMKVFNEEQLQDLEGVLWKSYFI